MLRQMAIAITLPGFNDLGRSVTLIFLMMARFLYQTFTFSLKNEENVSIRSLIILQNASSNSVFLALRLSVWRFQMPLKGFTFEKRWQHLELFTQQTHFDKICLRSFVYVDSPSIFLTVNPCRPC